MNRFSKIALFAAATIIISAAGWWLYQSAQSNTGFPELNEQGTNVWSDADSLLPTHKFLINPQHDTVVITPGGSLFAISANSFTSENDEPVTIEIREALNITDILKAGLSTMSNGELLETGGMFYINARQNEKSLPLNAGKSIQVQLPASEIKPDMQLFNGQRMADGSINWVNPKLLQKPVTPVPLKTLNFYPEQFLPTLKEFGFDINNRKLTDSIYNSYSGKKVVFYDEREYKPGNVTGKNLFKRNCSSCHYANDKKGTGPGLAGVLNRIPAEDWKYKWVRNSAEMKRSGDAYAQKIMREYNGAAMTAFPSLSNEDIDAIYNYVHFGQTDTIYQIDPALIAPLTDAAYEGTLIATHEFEKRLQVIFSLGNPAILDVYLNNINQSFRYNDSLVMVYFPEEKYAFEYFFNLNEGKVEINKNLIGQLNRFYQLRSEAVRKAAEKVYQQKMSIREAEDSLELSFIIDESKARGANFQKELQININDVFQQLGYPQKDTLRRIPRGKYYSFPVQQTGWYNVDRFVFETTTKRESGEFTDSLTGKTAKLTYKPFEVRVNQASSYNSVRAYLVSDSLPAYQQITRNGDAFKENLNMLLGYRLVVIARKNDNWFYAQQDQVNPGSITISVNSITENQLSQKLEAMQKSSKTSLFVMQMKAIEFEITKAELDMLRIKEYEKDEAIKKAIFVNFSTAPFERLIYK
jgi:cytochrome c2